LMDRNRAKVNFFFFFINKLKKRVKIITTTNSLTPASSHLIINHSGNEDR
jgi:hypothetical protein